MNLRSLLNFRHWRISVKLLATLLVLSWLPVAVVTVNYLRAQSQASQTAVGQHILDLGTAAASEIQTATGQVINQSHQALAELAAASALVDFLADPPADPDAYFSAQTEINRRLAQTLDAQPDFTRVTLYDREGIALASSDARIFGFDASSREDVQSALAGLPITARLKLGGADGQPGLFVSRPVLAEGQVVGAVSARLRIDFIYAEIERIIAASPEPDAAALYARSSRILLVNPEGVVLGHHGADTGWLYRSLGALDETAQAEVAAENVLGRACPAGQAGCTLDEMRPRLPAPLPALQPVGDALRAAAQIGAHGSLRYCRLPDPAALPEADCQNAEWVRAVFEPIRGPLRNNVLFFVLVDVQEAPFLEPARRTMNTSIGLALLFSLLVVLASFLLAEVIARPVRALAEVALEVEHGQPIAPERMHDLSANADELGHLARVFSHMIAVVQQRERELLKTVERLKVEIDQARRQKDVDEVAQSEFFQKLRARKQEQTRPRPEPPEEE